MAVEQTNWLDNFNIQEFLTLETYKAIIHVSIREFSTVEKMQTAWSLFFHSDMTWNDLIEGVAAELQLAQVNCANEKLLVFPSIRDRFVAPIF